ncbi:MAG: hypothetical protein KAS23_13995 [Anaerohalosphaera sp.]|nr:hypothetical protein [Anaerohalosphaera sp.]
MAQKQYNSYQQKVISSYYDNLDAIMLGKLQELVTDLFLAETETKQNKLWERAHKAMIKLKIKPEVVSHIMKTRSTTVLAKNLDEWLKNAK